MNAQIYPMPVAVDEAAGPSGALNLTLGEAVAYALDGGGSEFRRKLALAAGRACNLPEKETAALAEGVEMLHAASLIFDDMPGMDDARERRGRACLHLVTGEGQAVLAGLALVNKAYTLIWRTAARHAGTCGDVAGLVEERIGENGILGGQSRDLSFIPGTGLAEVKAIAAAKTGALLELSLLLPAVMAGIPRRERDLLSRISRYWGIAYQGIDDFDDLLGSGRTGKTPMRDLRLNRPNLVVALGLAGAYREIHEVLGFSRKAADALATVNTDWSFLQETNRCLVHRAAGLSAYVEEIG